MDAKVYTCTKEIDPISTETYNPFIISKAVPLPDVRDAAHAVTVWLGRPGFVKPPGNTLVCVELVTGAHILAGKCRSLDEWLTIPEETDAPANG